MAEVLVLRDGGAMAEQRHSRELSSGVGWALILLGGWSATLTSQRAYGR